MLFRLLFASFVFGLFGADVNVGKLRNAAEQAMTAGDVDQSIKLWNQVLLIVHKYFWLYTRYFCR